MGATKSLKALDIIPDESMDLSLLIEAHMPGKGPYINDRTYIFIFTGNFWQHAGTAGLIMSCSNADAVRLKAKQHPCVSYFFKLYFPNLYGSAGVAGSYGDWQELLSGCLYVEPLRE